MGSASLRMILTPFIWSKELLDSLMRMKIMQMICYDRHAKLGSFCATCL